ncbi:MAG: aliphatic sulfonate ABC transporter substrate-binding protein [Candidatus Velthaea sp.]
MGMLNRRSFIASSLSAVAATTLGAPAFAQAAPKILVGYWPVAAALPFFVMEHEGFFKAAGVDVELVKFADQVKVTEALLAGRIQATATGTGSTQLALAEIAQPDFFKILAANLSSEKSILDEFIVAKGAPYKTVADLKGKKIATGVGPQAMLEAKTILMKAGVDVVPVELSPAQHISAIVSGQIDAAYTYEPNGTVGRLNGTIQVLEVGVRSKYMLGNASAPWYGGAAVITSEFLKTQPEASKKYLAALKRGFAEVRKNINGARAVFPAYTNFDTKLAEAIPPISYTLYDEFKPSDIRYFQANYDLFFAEKVFTRKLKVASMLYRA